MKKWVACVLMTCLLALSAAGAWAAGVTLRAFTPFADMDFAAQHYMDMITAWEEKTGNVIEDYSGSLDEVWMAQMTGGEGSRWEMARVFTDCENTQAFLESLEEN